MTSAVSPLAFRHPALSVEAICCRYGAARALSDVSLEVPLGSIVAVLGANGAGKSTLARVIAGLVPASAGIVRVDGRDLTGQPAHRMRAAGVVYVPEGRGVFPALTVRENLAMAVQTAARGERQGAIRRAFDMFPEIAARSSQPAGRLSGGEQQMLSLARALAVLPRVIIADELSLGLAPKIVDAVFDRLVLAREQGVTVLLIEQFAARALALADHCVVLQRGQVSWSGPAGDASEAVLRGYLGKATAAVD